MEYLYSYFSDVLEVTEVSLSLNILILSSFDVLQGHSEPSQTFERGIFLKIVTTAKQALYQMFDRVLNTPLSRSSFLLTLSGRRSLSYRNKSIDLQSKSMDWFLYSRDLRPN